MRGPTLLEDSILREKITHFDHERIPEVERRHIVAGFRFELSKVSVPAIRERMVASLRNVSDVLARGVADGLRMALPAALPRATEAVMAPEVTKSSALSLTARPGIDAVRTRTVAILVADGVDGQAVAALSAALRKAEAQPRLIGLTPGALETEHGEHWRQMGRWRTLLRYCSTPSSFPTANQRSPHCLAMRVRWTSLKISIATARL
ncbi:catalase-related domain-containing protein [Gemmatimonas sp.]|uniref:catalase-related domain-containing protein n=1 Tax=Gemmatimonas sp. TaxID=1962908 RepID=UPI00398336BC